MSEPEYKTIKMKAGLQCKNCEHLYRDHSQYQPMLCYIEGCECKGLKLDVPVRSFVHFD